MDRLNSSKQLKEFIEGIPGGVGIYDVYADGTYDLVYLNDGYYHMIGATRQEREEYMGAAAIKAVPKEVQSEVREKVKTAILGDGKLVVTLPKQGKYCNM